MAAKRAKSTEPEPELNTLAAPPAQNLSMPSAQRKTADQEHIPRARIAKTVAQLTTSQQWLGSTLIFCLLECFLPAGRNVVVRDLGSLASSAFSAFASAEVEDADAEGDEEGTRKEGKSRQSSAQRRSFFEDQ